MGGIIMATINSNGTMVFGNTSGGSVTIAPVNNTSANYTLTIPNVSGTVALVDSQVFTGTPTAPTATPGTNTTQLATTAFVTTANNLKAPLSNPAFTGQVFIPEGTSTAPGLTFQNDGISNTGFYHSSDDVFGATCGSIPVASFTSSGVSLLKTPTAPTATSGTNTTQIATTAFVTSADNLKANIASPAFTGQVFIPEGTASSPGLTFQNDGAPDTGLYHISDGSFGVTCNTITVASFTTSGVSLLKTPTAPTATAGTNTTQIATTAMVHSAITNDLNVTGPAPMYACRAWVNFNGTNTIAIRASGNVSSITDNGTGNYTVNFTAAMPDANYVGVATTGSEGATAGSGMVGWCYSYTTSSLHIGITDNNGDTLFDNSNVNVAIFR
jgi:hypothetical protein